MGKADIRLIDLCKVTLNESDQVYYLILNNMSYETIHYYID
jgi:hypothetical protein